MEEIKSFGVFLHQIRYFCPENNKYMPTHTCPICKSSHTKTVFAAVTDYTVSHENFEIVHCENCSHRFTASPPAENVIGKYYQSEDYISHSNTQKGLVNRLYHLVRGYMLGQKSSMIQAITGKKTGKLLDIGCGTGAFLATMKTANWEVTGLEPDAGARKQVADLHGITALPSEALFGLAEKQFDVISMWHVMEHVHRLEEYAQQIHKILKDEGYFVVAVPNYTSLDADIYQTQWGGYDVPRHLHHFSPASMQYFMEKNGFKVMTHKPLPFDSFYVSLLSEKYLHGTQRLFAGFWNGLRSWFAAFSDARKCSSVIYIMQKK